MEQEKVIKQVSNLKILDSIVQYTETGTIYKAFNVESRLPMMVKIVSKDRIKVDPSIYTSLQKEISILKFLKSDLLFNYTNIVETESSYYLSTQFTNETSLRDYLVKSKNLSESKTFRIFFEVLAAYSEFFKLNTLYLNFMTKNVYLNEGVFRLSPFFKSKIPKSIEDLQKNFKINAFMSPEFLCCGEIDEKSDLWSLGIILFVIIFEQYPYIGDSLEELTANISLRGSEIVNEVTKTREIPADLKDLFIKILEPNKSKRIKFSDMITHKFMVRIKEKSEKYLQDNWKTVYAKLTAEKVKINEKDLKSWLNVTEKLPDNLYKEKNLKMFEKMNTEFADYAKILLLYNRVEPIFCRVWGSIEPLSPGKKLKKGSSIENKNVEDLLKASSAIKKAKTMIEIKDEEEGLHILNKRYTEEETRQILTWKYLNEIDFFGWLYEIFDFLKDFQKEFEPICLIARFCLIKYIYYRNIHLDIKVEEKANIFCLAHWEEMVKSKEYKNIKSIVKQRFIKDQTNIWRKPFLDLNEVIFSLNVKILFIILIF